MTILKCTKVVMVKNNIYKHKLVWIFWAVLQSCQTMWCEADTGRMGFFLSIEISCFDPAAMHFVFQGVQNLGVNSISFTISYGGNFKKTNIWIDVDLNLFAFESCETTVYIEVFLYLFHRAKKITNEIIVIC